MGKYDKEKWFREKQGITDLEPTKVFVNGVVHWLIGSVREPCPGAGKYEIVKEVATGYEKWVHESVVRKNK